MVFVKLKGYLPKCSKNRVIEKRHTVYTTETFETEHIVFLICGSPCVCVFMCECCYVVEFMGYMNVHASILAFVSVSVCVYLLV